MPKQWAEQWCKYCGAGFDVVESHCQPGEIRWKKLKHMLNQKLNQRYHLYRLNFYVLKNTSLMCLSD